MSAGSPCVRHPPTRRFVASGAVLCSFLGVPRAWSAGRPRPPLLVIDPGHGGRDPGASGKAGTLEKDVTLAIARTLQARLEAAGSYRVALTRSADRYMAREDRAGVAYDRGADLFLSLHADRVSDPNVRGASVYTLARKASDAETAALAERENGAGKGDTKSTPGVAPEISGILASLANRETRAISARIAHQLVRDMALDLPVLPSPERQANFVVLHAAGIPSVLIEMGFLSNPADEAALNDAAHRELVAAAVTRSIDTWFAHPRDGI